MGVMTVVGALRRRRPGEPRTRSGGAPSQSAEVIRQLTEETSVVLAAVSDGGPQVLLSLIGPTDRLVLVEAGVVSLAGRCELTRFGAVVAAAARETLDVSTLLAGGVTPAESGRGF